MTSGCHMTVCVCVCVCVHNLPSDREVCFEAPLNTLIRSDTYPGHLETALPSTRRVRPFISWALNIQNLKL